MATNMKKLPASWGSRGQVEQLTVAAANSLSRMIARAVAETGVNFQLNDAYRSKAEQISLFKANYRNRGTKSKKASSDRMYAGTAWRHVTNVAVASPDLYGTGTGANHTRGIAIDIIPSAIQTWIQKNGPRFGWTHDEGRRNGESWHFVFDGKDQYTSEGWLDHAAVQKAVGATVDGKIGTGTVAKIKAFQKAHKLDVDGKVGPATKRALGLSGKGDASTSGGSSSSSTSKASPGWMPGVDTSQKFSGNDHKAPVTKIVLHTTEGSSWPAYNGGSIAPHFTVRPGEATEENVRQHISTKESSKALANKAGGVETNNAGVIQIEFIGSCDKAYATKHKLCFTEDLVDEDLEALAAVLAWIHEAHGVPLTATGLSWPTTNAAYATAPQRFSGKDWLAYKGVCGHTHVPENGHWDPGNFPVSRLLKLAGGADTTISGGGSSGGSSTGAGKLKVDKRFGKDTSKALQRFLNSRIKGLNLKVDGDAGEKTWKGLQIYLAAPIKDGQISHQSYKPSELGNGIVDRKTAWEYTGRGSKGSTTIRLLQKWVGVKQDGVVYEGTTGALQRKLNVHSVGM